MTATPQATAGTLAVPYQQRRAVGGGNMRFGAVAGGDRLQAPLDGGDELGGLCVDDDVPAEQHALVDDLPGVPGVSVVAAMSASLSR